MQQDQKPNEGESPSMVVKKIGRSPTEKSLEGIQHAGWKRHTNLKMALADDCHCFPSVSAATNAVVNMENCSSAVGTPIVLIAFVILGASSHFRLNIL